MFPVAFHFEYFSHCFAVFPSCFWKVHFLFHVSCALCVPFPQAFHCLYI
jgi:hypothetical protein